MPDVEKVIEGLEMSYGDNYMTARKIDAMHRQYGTVDAKCKDCRWLLSGDYHGRRYYKCRLYGVSRSEATDWRLSYQACGAYNIPEDELDVYSPHLMQIICARKAEPPLEGQIRIELKEG